MTKEQNEQFVGDMAARLFEHYDCVQILCSWTEDGCTKSLNRGCGNWFARLEMARDFKRKDAAETQAKEIATALNTE